MKRYINIGNLLRNAITSSDNMHNAGHIRRQFMWMCELISVLSFITNITELPRDVIIIHRASHAEETTHGFIAAC
jgi:hypothetical protein